MKKSSAIERKIMPRPVPASPVSGTMNGMMDYLAEHLSEGGASLRSGPGVQLLRESCDPSVPPVEGYHSPPSDPGNAVEKAEFLPETTDRDVPKVAAQCGLRSPSAFCRAFRREKGASPGVWRKRRNASDPASCKIRTILQKRAGSIQKMTGLYKLVCLTGF